MDESLTTQDVTWIYMQFLEKKVLYMCVYIIYPKMSTASAEAYMPQQR